MPDNTSAFHLLVTGDPALLVERDKRIFNQHGLMLVNPEKHPTVKKVLG